MTASTALTALPAETSLHPQLHISASALRTLRDCPREFALKYILGVQREDLPSSMVLGSAVHAALEVFYTALRDDCPEPELDDLVRVAALAISKALVGDIPIAFAEGESAKDLVDEAVRLLEVFLEAGYRPAKVLAVETRFALALVHPVTGEVAEGFEEHVIGFFDLVCLDETGQVQVVDHKISKRHAPPKSTVLDIQMAIYAWAADQLFTGPSRLYHQTLVRTKSPRVELTEIPRAPADSVEAVEAVWAGLELIQLAVAHPAPLRLLGRQRSWKCASCSFRHRC